MSDNSNLNNKVKDIIQKYQQVSIDKSQECFFNGCKELAIESHVLQKNGIINFIVDNKNHVYEMKHNLFKKPCFYFKYTGFNETLKYKGFCNTHDTALFLQIENKNVDFSDYNTFLLFTYRSMMMERRKKLNVIHCNDLIMNSHFLNSHIDTSYLRHYNKQTFLGIDDAKYYEEIILNNIIDNSKKDFSFITLEIPKIEICASGVYTYETTDEINKIMLNTNKINEPLTEIYFHLIPQQNKSIVLMGCLNKKKSICWHYIKSHLYYSPETLLKKISDLLLRNIETWACSSNFYTTRIKPHERKILNITNYALDSNDERSDLPFNLFDNIVYKK